MAKLSMRERYSLLTRDLDWTPSYVDPHDVYRYTRYEGIKIHDWDAWEDPFRLTVDSYCKYQAEKDKKLYAVIESFAQGQGHLHLTDARYVNALKIFLQGVTPLEYAAHRHFEFLARHLDGPGPRFAALCQSVDELRHTQTEVHTLSQYNKYYSGLHGWSKMFEPGLVPERAQVVLRGCLHRRPLRVPDLDLVQLRVPAHQPAVRAVHERGQLQRRPGHDDVRLLRAERREPAHDPRPGRAQVHARAGRGQRADHPGLAGQVVLARIPAARPGRRDDGLHAAQEVHELEGGVRALLRGADAQRAVPRPGVLRHPAAPASGAGHHREGLHEPPGVLAALHLQPRGRVQHHDPDRGASWTGCRPATRTPSTGTTARCGTGPSGWPSRATGSSTAACRCSARPARSR